MFRERIVSTFSSNTSPLHNFSFKGDKQAPPATYTPGGTVNSYYTPNPWENQSTASKVTDAVSNATGDVLSATGSSLKKGGQATSKLCMKAGKGTLDLFKSGLDAGKKMMGGREATYRDL